MVVLFLSIKLHQTADQKGPKNTTVKDMGSYAQIWGEFMCITPGYGHLNTHIPLHWEQENYSKQN